MADSAGGRRCFPFSETGRGSLHKDLGRIDRVGGNSGSSCNMPCRSLAWNAPHWRAGAGYLANSKTATAGQIAPCCLEQDIACRFMQLRNNPRTAAASDPPGRPMYEVSSGDISLVGLSLRAPARPTHIIRSPAAVGCVEFISCRVASVSAGFSNGSRTLEESNVAVS
jgi:hypothetical protein